MITKQCAICGKKEKLQQLFPANFENAKISFETFSARRIPDRIHHRFVKCFNCGLIFSNPVMDEKEIAKLYSQSTFTYQVESVYLRKTYGGYLKKVINGKKHRKISLLDIGCGNGFFLEEAKEMGIEIVWGVEPGKKSAEGARVDIKKKIKVSLYKKDLFPNNYFDIITCFHTLDHILDPNAFLKIAYSNLKKGGKFLCIVHDTQGLSVKLFGEKSPIFDIEHMYLFNKASLKALFEKNEFKNYSVFNIVNTYPLSYWVRMIPLPKMIKNIMNMLTSTAFGKIPITIPAGNIGIIAEK